MKFRKTAGLVLLLLLVLTLCTAGIAETVYVTRAGRYLDLKHVAAYLTLYGALPSNYLTKAEARAHGWVSTKGNLWKVAPGCAIGGDRFGNYDQKLKPGTYYECDVNYIGGMRQAERLIYDLQGNLYYTGDHYNSFEPITVEAAEGETVITEEGEYLEAETVAYYLAEFGHLPANYLTKEEAKALGWVSTKGNLWKVAPGKAIGGGTFSNRDGLLPKGRYRECDVNYSGGFRGEERLVYDEKGNIYYTPDYYHTFEQWYGAE